MTIIRQHNLGRRYGRLRDGCSDDESKNERKDDERFSLWDIHHCPGNTSRHSRGLKVFGISELAALQKKIACLHKSSIIDQQKLTTFAKKQQNKLNDTWDTYRVRARQSANTEAWLSLLSGRSLQFISFSCLDFKHHSIKDCSSFFQYLLSWGEDGQP